MLAAGLGLRDRKYTRREGEGMRRDLQKNSAAGRSRPGWNGIACIVMALGIFMSITACDRQRPTDIEAVSVDTENGVEMPSAAMEGSTEPASAVMEDSTEPASAAVGDSAELTASAEEDRVEPLPTDIDMNEKEPVDIRDEVSDVRLIEMIEENVILGDDTEIEACEWVDVEKSCLRIRVQYMEPPSDNYQHKEDYFFFLEEEDIQALHVEYPTKDWHNMEEDRYVWDACDFAAHLEDVTFDDRDDLVIFLGHAGSRGDLIHGVYVYEDGFYHYNPGFEDIPNYEADTKEQVIRGWSDSAISSTTYVYKYQNGDFELISYEDYDTDVPGLNSYDIAP